MSMVVYNKTQKEIDSIVYKLINDYNKNQFKECFKDLTGNDMMHVCADIKVIADETGQYQKLYKKCEAKLRDKLLALGYEVL